MGQQPSRQPDHIYIRKKMPLFVFRKSCRTAQNPNPDQPIKFFYKTSKKTVAEKPKNNEKFAIRSINNLKSAIGGVKNINEVKVGGNGMKETKNNVKEAKNNVKEARNTVKEAGDTVKEARNSVIETKNSSKDMMIENDRLQQFETQNFRKAIYRTRKHVREVVNSVKEAISGQTEIKRNDIRFNCGEKEESDQNTVKECVFSDIREKNNKRTRRESSNGPKKQNVPLRTKSEPNLGGERVRERHRHRRKATRTKNGSDQKGQQFGYEIQDVDGFLAKATLDKPANIPVVLAFPSVLYRTRVGGYQAEVLLPLGMVVNAIFKNQNWLYVQTPHAEEGYVSYSACLPLGIIPSPENDQSSPCWEKSTDVFPKPSGNLTDTEKLSCKSECGNEEDTYCSRAKYRNALSTCGEKSVDRLYLRAAALAKGKGTRHTLLVINEDYKGLGKSALPVQKNEVVFLLSTKVRGWFYVKNKEGQEGFIPSIIAGHGFL